MYLDEFTDNKGDSPNNRFANLIQVDVSEKKLQEAEPIQLAAKFENAPNRFHYELPDKVEIDTKPPTAIKITKLPSKGIMKAKFHNGEEKIFGVGDVVPAEIMDNLVYDQETDECTLENKDNCQDTFSYIPLSSW